MGRSTHDTCPNADRMLDAVARMLDEADRLERLGYVAPAAEIRAAARIVGAISEDVGRAEAHTKKAA
jgi:hypothetical protein